MNTKIISGFPGVGKSYLFNIFNLKILDSDSSNFSWIKDNEDNNTKERNPLFPQNYIEHIKDNVGEADVILVSSHKEVRSALYDNNISFTLVYPDINCKEEYIGRYKKRGSTEGFINFISSKWEDFIKEIEEEIEERKIKSIKLVANQYLKDVI